MAHVRKMALVDPRLLETLRTPIQPPSDANLRDLDSKMTSILDKTGIDLREKVRLYNQALLRYNDMVKISSNKPTPVVVVKEKEPTMTADIKGEVVTILPDALQEKECQLVSRLKREVVMTLPKTLQEKGSQLVSRLKSTKWNDRGELLHEEVAIPGSNIVDLVHDLLRTRKMTDPIWIWILLDDVYVDFCRGTSASGCPVLLFTYIHFTRSWVGLKGRPCSQS